MLKKRNYRWAVEISLIIIVLFATRTWMQRDVVKGAAPNINHIMLDGNYFDLYQQKNKPVLIHFWATWCSVCKFEQSNIENIAKDYSVITVAMQSGDDFELSQFMRNEQLSFKVINDEQGILSKRYKIRGVPVSFVINKENKIEFVEVGYSTEIGLRLRLWWAGR